MFLQLLLFLGAYLTSALAQPGDDYLNDEILPRCFKNPASFSEGLYVNGQNKPLGNSLENFLSLVEKLELANPDMKLFDELFILLKNYTAENVYYQTTDKDPIYHGTLAIWRPIPMKMTEVEKLWEPDQSKELPDHIDPFEDDEKCSLFFMLSHTVNETFRPNIDQKSYAPSSQESSHAPEAKTLIPREQGVVSVRMIKIHAVALGRVLLGLYVGLKGKEERIKPVSSFAGLKNDGLEGISDVDILYLVSLADQLGISQYPLEPAYLSKEGLGQNGRWESVQFPPVMRTNDFPICPTVYELPINNTSAYTFSSLRGGVDGLILGDIIGDISTAQPSIRLTQILRMYYGLNGLQERSNAPASHGMISFCNRIEKIAPKEEILKNQIKVFLAFASVLKNYENIYNDAFRKYQEEKRKILLLDREFEDYCKSLQEKKDTPTCETAADIIFVMDTTQKYVDDGLEKQKKIIGHLANHLEMGYGGSTVTVFSDQRNSTYGLGLVTVISNTSSSACAACSAIQLEIDSDVARADKEVIIQSISEVLKRMEEKEKTLNGAKGKVVIFFNFQDEETVSYRLRSALRDLYMKHVGVQFFAIGNDKNVLKTYAQGQLQNVVTVLDSLPRDVADTLAKKICEVPSKLQYDDCKNGRNEAAAVYEGLISPNSIQRWAMYPKYFHKSLTAKMFFESDPGDTRQIEVCHSRAYSHAENQQVHCHKTSSSKRRIEFNTTNPCRAFNEHNCAPWYFTVTAVENSDEVSSAGQHYCQDTSTSTSVLRCKTLDQIKFRVSHEGIRCSSCPGLFSTPSLLLACFAAYILMKHMNISL